MDVALPDRLAREAYDAWHQNQRTLAAPPPHDFIAAAIRAALDEAAKVARECEVTLPGWTTKGGRIAQKIAVAIEALKG